MLNQWRIFGIFLFIFANNVYPTNAYAANVDSTTVPGSVNAFKVSGSSKVTEGKTVFLKWQKPSGFSEKVKYNLYIKEPNKRLRKYKYLISSTLSTRKMKGVGTHKFSIEACNTSRKCGPLSSLNVTVSAPTPRVPGNVLSFTVTDKKVTEGKKVFFTWKNPSGFSDEEVKFNFYLAKPGQKLSKYKSSIKSNLI